MEASLAAEFEEVYASQNIASITAAEFEKIYGALTRSEYGQYTRERALGNVLLQREPPIIVNEGVLRVWLQKYKHSVIVSSMAALQEEYGDLVKELANHHRTPYKLVKALRTTQAPPIIINDRMAKQWFEQNGKSMKNQRVFLPNGTLAPRRGIRTYFGKLY
jgi:hypothetical protein